MGLTDLRDAVGTTLYRQIGHASRRMHEQRSLPVDLLEGPDSYLVCFDAPGAERGDVQVRYLDGRVLVRVDRFREFREGQEMRFPGRAMTLDGELSLPDDAIVEPDAAMAHLGEHGTLSIELPKRVAEATGRADPTTVE